MSEAEATAGGRRERSWWTRGRKSKVEGGGKLGGEENESCVGGRAAAGAELAFGVLKEDCIGLDILIRNRRPETRNKSATRFLFSGRCSEASARTSEATRSRSRSREDRERCKAPMSRVTTCSCSCA